MKAQCSFKNVLMQRKGTIHVKVMEHLRTSHLLQKCPKVDNTTGNVGLCSELPKFMEVSLFGGFGGALGEREALCQTLWGMRETSPTCLFPTLEGGWLKLWRVFHGTPAAPGQNFPGAHGTS